MTHEIALLPFATGGLTLAAAWLRWGRLRLRQPLGLGDKAPDFDALPASDGRAYSLRDLEGSRVLVLVFTANRCPGAKAYEKRLAELHRDLSPSGVRIAGVNSISSDLYPSETLDHLVQAQVARGIPYPILRDADQRLARAMGAFCTPQVFAFDHGLRLRYRGRIDDSFVPGRVTTTYLRDAVRAILDDREPPIPETPPLGCAIDPVRPRRDPQVPWWKRAHELSLHPDGRRQRSGQP